MLPADWLAPVRESKQKSALGPPTGLSATPNPRFESSDSSTFHDTKTTNFQS
jgi:hypothetical protein